jgi:hypothetical protein
MADKAKQLDVVSFHSFQRTLEAAEVPYKFDDDIPLPETRGRPKYAFLRQMQVGQSFFVEGVSIGRMCGATWNFTVAHPDVEFACRSRKEDGVLGVRVWRVK